MARLLAAWEMGGGFGHVAKLAAAARPLAALGHESWLASRDVTAVKAVADKPFAHVVQAPIWHGRPPVTPTYGFGHVIAWGGFADDEGLSLLVRAWLSMFELVRPAGIYGSHAPASLLAAHVARLPAVRLGTPFICPAAGPAAASLMPWIRGPQASDDAVADRVVRAVCRHFGAPVLSGLGELLATAAPFLTSWPEIGLGPERQDSDYYGPLDGLAAAAAADWPTAKGPRVLVYLPFGSAQAGPLVAALGARGWPVAWMSVERFEGQLPANIRHEAEPLAMRTALDEAAIFVARGGHGSALDAVRAGCPMLLLPDSLETERNARALAGHGLARRIDGIEQGWDAASIGAALDALILLDAPERGAAAAARVRYADYDAGAAGMLMARRMLSAFRLLD